MDEQSSNGTDFEVAALRTLVAELGQSQWLSAESIGESQLRQARHVLLHAYEHTPFYRERLDAAGINPGVLDLDAWREVPILTRRDIQFAGKALYSQSTSAAHRVIGRSASSGSTGRPMLSLSTSTTQLFWNAFTIRDHLWHHRDFSGKLATIRSMAGTEYQPPYGHVHENWGAATAAIVQTGPCAILDIQSTIEEQTAWLRREDPDYLLTHPSNALALARYWLAKRLPRLRLRQVRTFGELLDPTLRRVCREAWECPVVDMYTAAEVGYIALQCPQASHYHVQAEGVLVEIIDDLGNPCSPGGTGRIVITSLTNLAMPLVRYEIGDWGVLGGECPCRRGLSVIQHVIGRQRNMCVLPDGGRRWPSLTIEDAEDKIAQFPPIQQFQLVQRTRTDVELKVVMHRTLSESEESLVRSWVDQALGFEPQLAITYTDHIDRGPGGKFEDFRCEVQDGTG